MRQASAISVPERGSCVLKDPCLEIHQDIVGFSLGRLLPLVRHSLLARERYIGQVNAQGKAIEMCAGVKKVLSMVAS